MTEIMILLEQMFKISDEAEIIYYTEFSEVITDNNRTILQDKMLHNTPLMPYDSYNFELSKYENVVNFQRSIIENKTPRTWFQQAQPNLLLRYQIAHEVGCTHYISHVKLQCGQCQKQYSCKRCHDDENDHLFTICSKITCVYCDLEQQIPDSTSRPHICECGKILFNYCCKSCNIFTFTNQLKPAYHCAHCNVCEIGLPHLKQHCTACNSCFTFEHKCASNITCSICQEPLFNSTDGRVQLPCGHSLHRTCRLQLLNSQNVKCPECRKLIFTGPQQNAFERIYLHKYLNEIIPPIWENKFVSAVCNECNCKFLAQQHPVGYRCIDCLSFNTALIGTFTDQIQAEKTIQEQNQQLIQRNVQVLRPIINDLEFYRRFFCQKFKIEFEQLIVQIGLEGKTRETQLIGLDRLFRMYSEGMNVEMARAVLYHSGII
ncbi:CHY_zinc finger domain-containing protein [Hexamita inflata]|uniref:CHY zinc finger domain-containing protein n=1 Tax=Hexamita inflata TaxID=28002 RepID=A0AA86NVI6_9EUKA|nr:CHY zinc finger domain-containing protein [Hexamita inflata]